MSTTPRASNTRHLGLQMLSGRHTIAVLAISSAVMIGLSGCGQKGALYLADSGSNDSASQSVLGSTSHPQDAAFAGVDDDSYEKERYLDEQRLLPEPSTDPNDY